MAHTGAPETGGVVGAGGVLVSAGGTGGQSVLPEPRCCPSCDLGYDITFGAFRQSEDGQPGELASEIQPGFAGCFVSWGSRSYTGQEKTECVGPVIEFSLMLE